MHLFYRNNIHCTILSGSDGDVLSKVLRGQPDIKQEEHPSIYGESFATETIDTHKGLPKAQPQVQKMSKQSYVTIHEKMKDELRKGNYKVNIAPSDLVDFGGQKSFDMTHQLFIQHKGEYILMFNGRFDFCDPLPEYPQGDVTTECKLV